MSDVSIGAKASVALTVTVNDTFVRHTSESMDSILDSVRERFKKRLHDLIPECDRNGVDGIRITVGDINVESVIFASRESEAVAFMKALMEAKK